MFTSLRIRLILSHLAVICVAMGLAAFLLLSFVQRYLLQSLEDSLVAQGRITAQVLLPDLRVAGPDVDAQAAASVFNTVQQQSYRNNYSVQTQNVQTPSLSLDGDVDLTYLSDASLQLSSQLDTRIRIVDAQGTVLVDTLGERGQSLRADPLVMRALEGTYTSQVSSNVPVLMQVALPLLSPGGVAGVVYLSQSLRDVTAVLNDLRARLLLSAALALLISALLALGLSQAIARPIQQLTAATETISRQHSLATPALDRRVEVRSHDELGRLGGTFNAMLDSLQAAHRVQTDFIASVSHELRTPLTSLKGTIETLQNGAMDDLEARDDFLATLAQETERMNRLVDDLLTLSRVDAEKLVLDLRKVDAAAITRSAVSRLHLLAEERGVTVDVCIPAEDALTVQADPGRLEQVLVNLLSNAIHYSNPGGVVSVGMQRQPQGVQIWVQDNGIGIGTADLAHIGERFYRADKARSRAAGGSGLGLAIARSLVEAQGGRLAIASREGQGTIVTFDLPAQEAYAAPRRNKEALP